jgi:hypothetical protein
MLKRGNFYKDGTFIPYQMPQDYRPSSGRGSCGNCGMFSQKNMFCGIYKTQGVRDTYVCNKWRKRYFKR